MVQITKEQAIQIAESGIWKNWTDRERFMFQMSQECLSMPFDEFHKSAEETLVSPIFTHMFVMSDLWARFIEVEIERLEANK